MDERSNLFFDVLAVVRDLIERVEPDDKAGRGIFLNGDGKKFDDELLVEDGVPTVIWNNRD